jgi:D-sedoheptulose 7-phosphate isomerase
MKSKNSKLSLSIQKGLINRIEESKKDLNLLQKSELTTDISKILLKILHSINRGNKIIFCGNGGSAADAQHLAAELIAQFLNKKRRSIPAISLTTNTSTITAIANDIDFKNIFSRQIESLGKKNDIFLCISTSGKSQNILQALKIAKKNKLITVLMTGKKKINNKNIDYQINTTAERVDKIQEQHILIGHFICEFLEQNFGC